MKKNIQIEVDLPSLPNFLRSKDQHSAISIKDFTKKELQELGEWWTRELIKKSQKK